jgi:hypothetical protein
MFEMTAFRCLAWLPPSDQTMKCCLPRCVLKLPTLHKSCHDSYIASLNRCSTVAAQSSLTCRVAGWFKHCEVISLFVRQHSAQYKAEDLCCHNLYTEEIVKKCCRKYGIRFPGIWFQSKCSTKDVISDIYCSKR